LRSRKEEISHFLASLRATRFCLICFVFLGSAMSMTSLPQKKPCI